MIVLAWRVAVLLGGTVIVLGIAWLVSRRHVEVGPVIPKPVQKFGPLTPMEADAMRARAEARRDRAEGKHAEGHAIETGQPDRSIKLISRSAR